MKIGFTGSQGTGKTSLAKAMVDDPAFGDYIFVPSAARDSMKAGFKINKEAGRLDQVVTTMARVAKEHQALKQDNVIADRMLIDSHAYSTYQKECVWIRNDSDEYLLKVSGDLALISADRYEKVFFFPPYWQPVDDDVRAVDLAYQISISDIIEEFLHKNDVVYEVVPPFSVEERLEWMIQQVY